jgi:hypothetical protein
MSKMSELSLAIAELKRCSEALLDVSESLTSLFSSHESSQGTVPPDRKTSVTLGRVRAVLAEKSRAGHTAGVRKLLEKHGAEKLSDIDPSGYPALLAEAEVLGNG